MTPTGARALAERIDAVAVVTDDGLQRLNPNEVRIALRSLADQVEALESELSNIAEAKRHDRQHFADDTDFADWAQSRARFTLDHAREAT